MRPLPALDLGPGVYGRAFPGGRFPIVNRISRRSRRAQRHRHFGRIPMSTGVIGYAGMAPRDIAGHTLSPTLSSRKESISRATFGSSVTTRLASERLSVSAPGFNLGLARCQGTRVALLCDSTNGSEIRHVVGGGGQIAICPYLAMGTYSQAKDSDRQRAVGHRRACHGKPLHLRASASSRLRALLLDSSTSITP
jgi:hypothetical protein